MKKAISAILALAIAGSMCACGAPASPTAASNAAKANTEVKEKIKLVAPKLGYNDTQIATAKKNAADQKKDLTNEDKYYMSVRKSIEKDYPDYEVEYADWGWAEQLDQKQRTLLTSGDAPSLVAGETLCQPTQTKGFSPRFRRILWIPSIPRS